MHVLLRFASLVERALSSVAFAHQPIFYGALMGQPLFYDVACDVDVDFVILAKAGQMPHLSSSLYRLHPCIRLVCKHHCYIQFGYQISILWCAFCHLRPFGMNQSLRNFQNGHCLFQPQDHAPYQTQHF